MDKSSNLVDEFMTALMSLAKNTRVTYGIALREFLAYCDKPFNEINKKDIEAWDESLFDRGCSASTVHVKLAALNRACLTTQKPLKTLGL